MKRAQALLQYFFTLYLWIKSCQNFQKDYILDY